MATPICRRLLRQWVRLALARASVMTGRRIEISTAMMPMTTSSSINVKPDLRLWWCSNAIPGRSLSPPLSRAEQENRRPAQQHRAARLGDDDADVVEAELSGRRGQLQFGVRADA